ncbi:hypothetical protein [Foetidibacter luteolus]|uniref:hypothetical protein n=1 Tax=Foetidibacter luteolus TaxID=2608880 RepID=UPI00129B7505|nr:hypothetical protein [Foetidibacter luteolus]
MTGTIISIDGDDSFDELAAEYLQETIKIMLIPFEKELRKQGVSPVVIVDIPNSNVILDIEGADQQLVQRIRNVVLDF